jgi:hypothetical protein
MGQCSQFKATLFVLAAVNFVGARTSFMLVSHIGYRECVTCPAFGIPIPRIAPPAQVCWGSIKDLSPEGQLYCLAHSRTIVRKGLDWDDPGSVQRSLRRTLPRVPYAYIAHIPSSRVWVGLPPPATLLHRVCVCVSV